MQTHSILRAELFLSPAAMILHTLVYLSSQSALTLALSKFSFLRASLALTALFEDFLLKLLFDIPKENCQQIIECVWLCDEIHQWQEYCCGDDLPEQMSNM